VWVDEFHRGGTIPYGGWLAQNKAWWDAHVAAPDQVLWITYEMCVTEPASAVRKVATFLGITPTAALVDKTVAAITFDKMKMRLENNPKMRSGHSGQLKFFTPQQLQDFDATLVQPAIAHGMPMQLAAASSDPKTPPPTGILAKLNPPAAPLPPPATSAAPPPAPAPPAPKPDAPAAPPTPPATLSKSGSAAALASSERRGSRARTAPSAAEASSSSAELDIEMQTETAV